MRPQTIRRPAIAAMLDIDALDLPSAVEPDWETGYPQLRAALATRGWRLAFHEYTSEDLSVADILDHDQAECDDVDRRLLWLISCSHPSFAGDAHVIVARGGALVFDPGGDELQRPPLEELVYHGGFMLSPLDPSAFALRSAA